MNQMFLDCVSSWKSLGKLFIRAIRWLHWKVTLLKTVLTYESVLSSLKSVFTKKIVKKVALKGVYLQDFISKLKSDYTVSSLTTFHFSH